MPRSNKRIRIAHLNLFFDSIILLSVGCILILVYRFYSDLVVSQERMEQRRLLESMSASANNYVIHELDFMAAIIPFFTDRSISEEQRDTIRRSIVRLNALYQVSDKMRVTRIYLMPGNAQFYMGVDISKSRTVPMILDSIHSGRRRLAPLHVSIITAKDTLAFIFPVDSGAIIAEPDLSGLFQSVSGAGLLDLYRNSIVLLLKPDSNDVLFRSRPEAYPYWEFMPDASGLVTIQKEPYTFDDLVLSGMNIRMVVLTPKRIYEGSLDAFRRFSIILFLVMVLIYVFRRFWEHRAIFHPLESFLAKIHANPLGEVTLESNYAEWIDFEKVYNDAVHKMHRMADDLRSSEVRSRALLEANPDMMFLFSEKGDLLDYSAPRGTVFFAPPEQCIGRNLRDVLPADVADLTLEMIARVHADGKPVLFEYVMNFERTIYYETRLVPCGPMAFLASVRDISERKTAEQTLRRNEQQLRSITDNLPGAVFQFLVHSTGEREFTFVSDRLREMIDFDPEPFDTLLLRFTAILHPEDRQRFEESVQQAVAQKGHWEFEGRIRRNNGTERWVRGVAEPSETDTDVVYNGLLLDITQLKAAESDRLEMERRMLHVQKLESLGVLAGGMAHDFNNILMAVLGHAELALMNLTPDSPAHDHFQQILSAANRSAELCRQMLAYAGKGKFLIESISLSDIVREMIHLLQASISKKVTLNLSLDDDLPRVEGDTSQIRQILLNLITNASEAIGDQNGTITLSTGKMNCDRRFLEKHSPEAKLPEGMYVYLEVSDSGCGMNAETLKHVYEPFFTTKFTGRGLGMAALLGIVRGHKGVIRVQSEVGRGTSFRILLPAGAKPQACLPVQSSEPVPVQRGGCILLVDDEESIRAVGRAILNTIGFSVLTAANGKEALQVYVESGEKIDLVLLDLTMPLMDGEETFRELIRINPEIRVIICSGYTEVDITTRFAEKVPAGFIQKPYSRAEITEKIRRVLEVGSDAVEGES